MLASRTFLILTLVTFIGGCFGRPGGSGNSTANATNEQANSNRSVEPGMEGAKDNAEELGTLIRMPFEPEDLVWKEMPANAKGKRLLAVFQFTPTDAKKLVENASKIRPGSALSLSTEKWFPKELVTQSEMSNDEGIPATSYAADEFLQPPYTEGTISQVNNSDFFVLEVFARQ